MNLQATRVKPTLTECPGVVAGFLDAEANHQHHHHSHHSSWGYTLGALKFHQGTSSAARSNHVPIGPIKEPTLQPSSYKDVFLSENSTVVLAQTGSTPIMHCEVGDIGEGMVSRSRVPCSTCIINLHLAQLEIRRRVPGLGNKIGSLNLLRSPGKALLLVSRQFFMAMGSAFIIFRVL